MFLDDTNTYLTEAYAKGKMASDYISKIRQQCTIMTYIPGFDRAKVKRLEGLIETYEDKLKLAKQELADYKTKSKTEKEKIEKLNKIDTILSTSIKIAVIILSIFVSYTAAAKLAPSIAAKAGKIIKSTELVKNAKNISRVRKIIASIGGFAAKTVSNKAKAIAVTKNAVKIFGAVKNSAKQVQNASDTIKIGGYEAEIIKCIREMELLLVVLKKKKAMFESEIEKRERGIR